MIRGLWRVGPVGYPRRLPDWWSAVSSSASADRSPPEQALWAAFPRGIEQWLGYGLILAGWILATTAASGIIRVLRRD
jgi:hypothetical protein